MPPSIDLSDDERFSLMKFRRNVSDCVKPNNDIFLLRWLRARNFNTEAAEKMLRTSLEWRKRWDVDNIMNWNPPEVCLNYYPSGSIGFDKEGSPVVIVPFAGLDMFGMMHCVTKEEFIKYTIRIVEYYIELAIQRSETYGIAATKLIVLMDMDNFSLKQYSWRPAAETVFALLQMYEANYPEILKMCFVINAPRIFSIAFSVVKTFLHEQTINKIQVFDKDRRKWQPKLFEFVDHDQIPAYFGGNATDPDGNPKCISKIKQGGKIPKRLYLNKKGDKATAASNAPDELAFTTATIKKGDKLILPVHVDTIGSFVRWEFHTDSHDIKFGVECVEDNGNKTIPIEIHRVNSHRTEEVGFLQCFSPSTYNLIFDNGYSFLRNKSFIMQ